MGELGIDVRAGRSGDVDGVVALEHESEGAPHWSEGIYRAIVEGGDDGRILLVAAVGEELVGFAVASGRDGVAELENVVVRLEWRRRGVGGRLCGELMRWAAARGMTAMELEVRCSSGAVGLYERLGFRRQGMRRGYYGNPVEDALLMGVGLA